MGPPGLVSAEMRAAAVVDDCNLTKLATFLDARLGPSWRSKFDFKALCTTRVENMHAIAGTRDNAMTTALDHVRRRNRVVHEMQKLVYPPFSYNRKTGRKYPLWLGDTTLTDLNLLKPSKCKEPAPRQRLKELQAIAQRYGRSVP